MVVGSLWFVSGSFTREILKVCSFPLLCSSGFPVLPVMVDEGWDGDLHWPWLSEDHGSESIVVDQNGRACGEMRTTLSPVTSSAKM